MTDMGIKEESEIMENQEPIADFVCRECGFILTHVYLDSENKTVISVWISNIVSMNIYRAELTCPICGEKKIFHSAHNSAITLKAINYGE